MTNEDCSISYFVGSDDSDLYKNATGDEMVYIEQGWGGPLDLGPGARDSQDDGYAWTWLEGR
ncbi:MAG: hypothetical protein M3112_10615, partial [Actinomycetia bacterium]|nr:hypothetical protein [Actinomycetes bacterium]